MIAYLRGILIDKSAEGAVVDVGGVGYAVFVTAAAHRGMGAVGAETRLFIYTHTVQDGPIQLFGFLDADERRIFEALLAVQGVGPKVAVAILAGLPPTELVRAIATADVARLTQIRGVGRKIAERMAVELREKIGFVVGSGSGFSVGSAIPAASGIPPGRRGEAWAALVALGYKPSELDPVVSKLDGELSTPELVKQALAALRRR